MSEHAEQRRTYYHCVSCLKALCSRFIKNRHKILKIPQRCSSSFPVVLFSQLEPIRRQHHTFFRGHRVTDEAHLISTRYSLLSISHSVIIACPLIFSPSVTRCWELSAGNIKWIYQVPILTAIGVSSLHFRGLKPMWKN